MALPRTLTEDQHAALDDAKKGAYIKAATGSGFVLDVEFEDTGELKRANERLKEERNGLRDSLATEKARLEKLGLDDEEIAEAVETLRKKKEKELIDKGEVDTLIEQRVAKALAKVNKDHESVTTTLTEQKNKLAERLNKELVDSPVLTACVEHGVRKTAVDDVLSRARRVWFVDQDGKFGDAGNTVPLGPDGQVLRSATGDPLTMGEWFTALQVSAEHLFETNSGAGGINPAASGALPVAGQRRSQMSNAQKNTAIEKLGYDGYMALPE